MRIRRPIFGIMLIVWATLIVSQNAFAVDPTTPNFRFIFISGFLNEKIYHYFKDNKTELENLGVPADRIHELDPPTENIPEVNAAQMVTHFIKYKSEGPEPLVIVAH